MYVKQIRYNFNRDHYLSMIFSYPPPHTHEKPRFIAVEGPLCVGKSTLASILAKRLHGRRLYDCEDNPFLSEFYKEIAGAAFRTQMYYLVERQKRISEATAITA